MVLDPDESRQAHRPDGRRPLYVYLPPDLIVSLKKAALDENRPVYALVEDAVTLMLQARGVKAGQGEKK
ncbi:MAG: hypothetical protein K2X54_27175 [Methylobacterium organophilum]|nr:hypothetical protein [Methylobacterium organophilum]